MKKSPFPRRFMLAAPALALLFGVMPVGACEVALSEADLDRLVAIALGTEYGAVVPQVVKWVDDVRVGIEGEASAANRAALGTVIDELSELIAPTRISLVTDNANVRVHFAPEPRFESILPEYEPTNMGYFWTWWSDDLAIVEADVLISTTGVTQQERNHLIREEVTQMLGLMRDVTDDPESTFYAGWTSSEAYTESDRQLVRALYCADVETGMDETELRAALAG
jgi:hypothetical protein